LFALLAQTRIAHDAYKCYFWCVAMRKLGIVYILGFLSIILSIYWFWPFRTSSIFDHSPREYVFSKEPIDVVIPTASKDICMLKRCIEGVKNNCRNIRRIIIVSSSKLTDDAEWFDEKYFPFSKYDVALYLNQNDEKRAKNYFDHPRCSWYFQQLLKLYAPLVIPDISSNVLILDADVIFFQPVEFLNNCGGGNYATRLFRKSRYLKHAERLLPGLKPVHLFYSGVAHHMIFQKPVLEDLHTQVEKFHKQAFWKAFCQCVDKACLGAAGASEYEIYFTFVFTRTKQVTIRPLIWMNNGDIDIKCKVIILWRITHT
jgi:hypothetical protein